MREYKHIAWGIALAIGTICATITTVALHEKWGRIGEFLGELMFISFWWMMAILEK